MDHGWLSTGAVEPPRARVEREVGPRRHRRITGPSGLLLFVCMFLPAVKGCGAPVYPLEMPMFLPPYVYGIAFAIGASVFTARGLRLYISALRWITIMTVAGAALMTFLLPPVGIVELLVATVLLAAIGLDGYSERRAATMTTAIGVVCTMWFGLWSASSDALLGVYLSLVASLGLWIGGLVWIAETSTGREVPIVLPRAVARDSR